MKGKDNKGFWDRWAKRYDFAMSGDGRTYAQIVSLIKRKLNRDMTVLELACGTGLLSVRLAGSVKLLEATDFSEEMIRQAKAKAHSSCLHFSVQDATNLPYAPGIFDAVVISNALHIMPEPGKAVIETGGSADLKQRKSVEDYLKIIYTLSKKKQCMARILRGSLAYPAPRFPWL